jgi:hypothetical protein
MPGDIEQSQSLSDLNFCLPVPVDLSSVKEVNAMVPGSLNAINCSLLGLLRVGVEPVAERDD